MSFLAGAAGLGTADGMTALSAVSISALDNHSLALVLHNEPGSLNQSVCLVANLRILAGESDDIRCSLINGALTLARLVRPINRDAAARRHVRDLIVPEIDDHVRRLNDHILLLRPDAACIVDDAAGLVVIQSV